MTLVRRGPAWGGAFAPETGWGGGGGLVLGLCVAGGMEGQLWASGLQGTHYGSSHWRLLRLFFNVY